MRYHKAHLTRRLILDISADSEIEENMVEWLRVSVGWERAELGCVGLSSCLLARWLYFL